MVPKQFKVRGCTRQSYASESYRSIDGRWVVDDYYEDRVLEEITAKGLKPGDPVGDMQDPRATKEPDAGLDLGPQGGRGERTGGGLGPYRAGGPTTIFGGAGYGPFSEGPLNAPKKAFYSREGVNEENWMFEAAQRTISANEDWVRSRKEGLKVCGGVFGDAKADGLDDSAAQERQRQLEAKFPMGAYEAHSGIVLCE
jgi:chromatin structure-remodeling complex protein RSC7